MSKDWQEALQEEVSYQELEEKYIKRTAELSIKKEQLSRTAWKLNEVNEILAQTQHKLEEANAIINKRNKRKVA